MSLNKEAYLRNVSQLTKSMHAMIHDLEKAVKGNKAASQRVRTESVRFEKLAKLHRKLSIWRGNEE